MFFCYFTSLAHFPGNNYTPTILFRSCKGVSSEVEKKSSKSKKKKYLCFIKPMICLTFTFYTLTNILHNFYPFPSLRNLMQQPRVLCKDKTLAKEKSEQGLGRAWWL